MFNEHGTELAGFQTDLSLVELTVHQLNTRREHAHNIRTACPVSLPPSNFEEDETTNKN